MNNVKIFIEDFAPTQGKFSWIDDAINARIGSNDFESTIRIVRLLETCYYNRVLNYDSTKKLDWTSDNKLIINAPCIFIDERAERKSASNAIFPAESIVLALTLKKSDMDQDTFVDIVKFVKEETFYTLLKYSNINDLELEGNDILYKGKKFFGEEEYIDDKSYSITAVITCYYNKYKDIFEQGLINPGVKKITGICDEILELNPEFIIQALYKRAVEIFNK